ncbi:hypothetical protein [Meiothermus ruber]|jgi:cell shape-determining protein MreC|uniref:hypothetical protein n=1 Tax=Meiothermus ruber TaxID=277 RepID=UPI0012E09D8C|nr:hypothetical protein [Meiothermus ruber]MCL6529763.1 hypothetical protein [Meiothermus ruber]
MATRTGPTEKTVEGLMNIPSAYWEELLEEMDTFKSLYHKAKALPPEKREKAQEALLSSLIHLLGHLRVIYDEANA